MKKLLILTSLFLFFSFTRALAQTTLKAQVDKTHITTDDTLTYKLTIDSEGKDVSQPKLPSFAGFEAVSQVQSSQISFENSGAKAVVTVTIILVPLNAGKFKIEPSQIKIKGKTYQSKSFDIEVAQGKTNPKPPQEQVPEALPEFEQPQYTL